MTKSPQKGLYPQFKSGNEILIGTCFQHLLGLETWNKNVNIFPSWGWAGMNVIAWNLKELKMPFHLLLFLGGALLDLLLSLPLLTLLYEGLLRLLLGLLDQNKLSMPWPSRQKQVEESNCSPASAPSPAPAAAPSPPWWTSPSSVWAPESGYFHMKRRSWEQSEERRVKGGSKRCYDQRRASHLLRPLPPPPPPRPPFPPLLISTFTRLPQSRVPSSSLHASVASLLSWKV